MKSIRKITLLMLTLALASVGSAQKVIKTKSGQKIVVTAHGHWKTFNPEQDQMLDESSLLISNDDIDPFEMPLQTAYAMDRAEESSISKLLEKAKWQEAEAAANLDLLETRVKNIEKVLSGEVTALEKDALYQSLQRLDQQIEDVVIKYDISSRLITQIDRLKTLKPSERAQELEGIRTVINQDFDITVKPIPSFINMQDHYTFKKGKDLRYQLDCQIAFNGIDKQTKKPKVELKPSHFFSYTHNNLKHYFKSDNFLDCDAFLSKEDDNKYLNLRIIIKSKDAKKTYGGLDKKSMIRITFIDGQDLVLNNLSEDKGVIQEYTGNTEYLARFLLDNDNYKQIAKKEVDFVGLIWSTGFEKYDIYEVDLLKLQAECLKKID